MNADDAYRQYARTVFQCALDVTRRRDVAETLTVGAFVAFGTRPTTEPPVDVAAWLLMRVRDQARDWWASQLDAPHAAEAMHADEANVVPPPALEQLLVEAPGVSPRQRTAFVLRHVHGRPVPEVAALLGVPEAEVELLVDATLRLLQDAVMVTA